MPLGMLSEVDLAAQHVVIMLAYINYMVCLGGQYTNSPTFLSWRTVLDQFLFEIPDPIRNARCSVCSCRKRSRRWRNSCCNPYQQGVSYQCRWKHSFHRDISHSGAHCDTETVVRSRSWCFVKHVNFCFPAVIAILQGFVLGSTKTVIGYIFTSDE